MARTGESVFPAGSEMHCVQLWMKRTWVRRGERLDLCTGPYGYWIRYYGFPHILSGKSVAGKSDEQKIYGYKKTLFIILLKL